jgi:Ca2+-transporting ATPase
MPPTGLSSTEAAERLARIGPNELPAPRGRTLAAIVVETLREPMFVLLIAAAALYLVLGERGEGLFLLAGAAAAVGLVIFQEARSESALAALRTLAQPHARVLRDGTATLIPAREIVPGDLVLVAEGDRVPVDGVLVGGSVLGVDESALTGESAPVTKRIGASGAASEAAEPGPDDTPFLFAGALVVRGEGLVEATRTGARSALGRIGQSLSDVTPEATPLQRRAGRLVALLGLLALGFCGVVWLSFGLLRHDWIGGALAGITVAISLIPEEFPMVLAVFLAMGAWRLATHRVLVRRSAVIETLGGATILCVDKTGTLTENHMRVARAWAPAHPAVDFEHDGAPPPAIAALLDAARLASNVRPVDPMDRAIHEVRQDASEISEPVRIWPLEPQRLAVVQAWPDGEGVRLAAKGAPEAVFRLCRLSQDQLGEAQRVVGAFAEAGLRVLGVAVASCAAPPETPEAATFAFAGLVGFLDPLRADVVDALAEARGAGIDVLMITGDHPATAAAIARRAGIATDAGVLLGSELQTLSADTLRDRLRSVRVCARVAPEQKLRIVEALRSGGAVVAMTGDGVNDAPALEAAHIGIAMGRKGSDVAREAADLVLLDDSFASIVGGVRLGRRIFANLRKALTFVTAVHVPIAGLALAPILFGMPQLLFPMHVVLLELAIDPTCALAFESERSDVDAMKRPPRRIDEPLFGPRQIATAVAQGLVILVGALAAYAWAIAHLPEPEARATGFLVLALSNLVLALADAVGPRGRLLDPHRRIYWAIAGALAATLALVIAAPAIADLFRMAAPPGAVVAGAVALSVALGGWPWAASRVRARLRPRP